MMPSLPCISGIGSVSPYGPRAGAFTPGPLEPSLITAWPTEGERRAYLVPPFRPADIAPGLKTRRLDRLSVWSLVAAALAVQDSGLDLNQVDRSRLAVVFGTELGCIELTEAFFRSAAAHGWSQTDPILFPEIWGMLRRGTSRGTSGCAGRILRSVARAWRENARCSRECRCCATATRIWRWLFPATRSRKLPMDGMKRPECWPPDSSPAKA